MWGKKSPWEFVNTGLCLHGLLYYVDDLGSLSPKLTYNVHGQSVRQKQKQIIPVKNHPQSRLCRIHTGITEMNKNWETKFTKLWETNRNA